MNRDRIVGTTKKMAGKAERVVGDAAHDRNLNLAGKANEAEGSVQELYGRARDTAVEMFDEGRERAAVAYRIGEAYTRRGIVATQMKIATNPLKSVAIAAGLGMGIAAIVSAMTGRRR